VSGNFEGTPWAVVVITIGTAAQSPTIPPEAYWKLIVPVGNSKPEAGEGTDSVVVSVMRCPVSAGPFGLETRDNTVGAATTVRVGFAGLLVPSFVVAPAAAQSAAPEATGV